MEYFVNSGAVTIGWGEVGPILPQDSSEDILTRCGVAYPGDTNGGHQVRRFVRDVAVGDAVVTYDAANRLYYVGIVRSPAKHGPSLHGGKYPGYSRQVERKGNVSRDSLSANARNQLGGLLTVFALSAATAQELRQHSFRATEPIIDGSASAQSTSESDSEEILNTVDILSEFVAKSEQFVEDQIAKLGPYELQYLVAGLLRALGYRTRVSGRGSDRGVDIFASTDGVGLNGPRIFVEVKHRSRTTDAPKYALSSGGGTRETVVCM